MVWPLIALTAGSFALSGISNMMAQYNSRALYRRQINAYNQMYNGYDSYLARHGRRIDPTRGYLKYGQYADSLETGIRNSYAHSLGTAGGTFGAGTMSTSRWL